MKGHFEVKIRPPIHYVVCGHQQWEPFICGDSATVGITGPSSRVRMHSIVARFKREKEQEQKKASESAA